MTEWAERNTVQCEVVKISMAQDKNGHVLKLSIHPNDLPKDLVLDPLGTRYIAVFAKLNDQDEIETPKDKSEGERAVNIAGLLCRNNRFVHWLYDTGLSMADTELGAIDAVRQICGIKSRAEFRTNEEARARFFGLKTDFEADLKKGDVRK